MATRKTKKYRMSEIPKQVSEKGGFTASFVSDGYTVDGLATILPVVLRDGGMKVSEGVAREIVHGYNAACLNHTATTGETVDMGDTMSMLSIRGLYAKSDSQATRDNVRVSMRLKEDMRPKVTFSMSNVLDGRTLTVSSATTDGCELNHVRQGEIAAINGLWLKMLDGDSVTATMKDAARHDVEAECEIISSRDDRVEVRVPAAFDDESFIGKEIVFTVTNSCGQPGMTQQTKRVAATLLAGGGEPTPEPTPDPDPEPVAQTSDGLVKVMAVADDETGETFTYGDTWSVRGEGFAGTASGWAVNMAFVQLEPEAEDPVVLDFDVRGAAEIKLDDKPEHPVAAGDYPDAKLLIEFCHPDGEDPETQVSETLEVPIHIVSNE